MGSSIPDLEVDVNGEEIFLVNKRLLACYLGKISKLLKKSEDAKGTLKVILNDFPGGAAIFYQILRFCYNNGKVEINVSNITSLSCAAFFMEMKRDVLGSENLYEKTEKSLEEIQFWSWGEVMAALSECTDFLNLAISTGVIHKLLDSVVCRIALSIETSPSSSVSSSDSCSGCRFSCDTRSTEIFKKSAWWFEDVVTILQTNELIRIMVELMISKNFDNGIVGRFLFYYQRSRCSSTSREEERINTIETVVELLDHLDVSTLSHKSLFRLLRVGSSSKISQRCQSNIEHMIGSRLDHATLDSLLIPSPSGTDHLFDVKLVLRLLKSFLSKHVSSNRLKKVVHLIDMYLIEVAPDPDLKPAIFTVLINSIPDSARDSLEGVYDAMKLYLEVHRGYPKTKRQ